jgi:hypothetical protein
LKVALFNRSSSARTIAANLSRSVPILLLSTCLIPLSLGISEPKKKTTDPAVRTRRAPRLWEAAPRLGATLRRRERPLRQEAQTILAQMRWMKMVPAG